MMTTVPNTTARFSIAEAMEMYRRLRQCGQSSTLARLSVEARCGDLTPNQRREVSRLLRDSEVASA